MGEPAVRASGIVLDGAMRKIPGFNDGDYFGDQRPLFVSSGLLDFFDGTAASGYFAVPFDYTVVAAYINVTETLGTASSLLNIGTVADSDKFVDDFTVAYDTMTAGTYNVATLTETVTGSQGDVLVFASGNGATTTGKGVAGLIIVPRI